MKRFMVALLVCGFALVASPASAHQPVTLTSTSANVARSPILVDGTVSFAVYANFAKAKQTQHIRFVLDKGDTLKADYLILDKVPERTLKQSQLPRVVITAPSGRVFQMSIRERTTFFEPFGGKTYFYLSRLAAPAEPGVYTVTMTSRAKSDIVVAIGSRETRGEVLSVGTRAGTCPATLSPEATITQARADQLISMTEDAAHSCATANRWGFRVGERDGESFPVTMDYRPDRVTVSVTAGRVTAVVVG